MAIKHKKSFLTGYLTGQAIKRGFNSTFNTQSPDGSVKLHDYDAASFKAGLAAGLCGDGYLLPYTPPDKKPGIFDVEVNCDEVIIDLYLRNACGEATAPSIYGLQDMGGGCGTTMSRLSATSIPSASAQRRTLVGCSARKMQHGLRHCFITALICMRYVQKKLSPSPISFAMLIWPAR